jgi:BirA family biotin operon repressor/biotin-[acetyl-CoA-carboxylase] ligase
MNIDICYYDDITSTNEVLKQMALDGAESGKVLVAWHQSQGRGRLGRTFESPAGGIYMSMLLDNDNTMLLTAKAAVATRRAIEQNTDRKVGIKWVNDIMLNGKKVAGILAQGVADKVVVGVGINFCTDIAAMDASVRDIADTLYKKWQTPECDAIDIVNSLVREMYDLASESDTSSWLEEYRSASIVLGKKVNIFQAGQRTGSGTAVSIDENCALHVLDEKKGEVILSTGEITLRLS